MIMPAASTSTTARTDAADARIPPPQDTPYPGTIALHVDAADTSQGIFYVRETIPVQPGELTLLYPKWLPGNHSPTGPIDKLAGLKVTAGGEPIVWERDRYDVYAFHIAVPKGVSEIDLDYQYLSARGKHEGSIEMTSTILDLVWSKLALYPAGHYISDITYQASAKLPHGWRFATALEEQAQSDDTVTFKPTTFNTLVDSPVYAGLHFKRLDLDPGAEVPVAMHVFADAPRYLAITPAQLKKLRALVAQAYRLFDSHHYGRYDFLFSLSDQLSGKGLEHHQSSEDGTRADFFTNWDERAPGRDLLAHEFTHSWNGKFRRPVDLWTPNFNVPMGDSMLWVYEGMTHYWGFVLTARSGLWSPQQFRDALALGAATYDRNRPGFEWRNVQDTTNDPTIAQRAPLPYRSWQMSEEYYQAGQLIWLAMDAKIRSLTDGRNSLDDFARAFLGMDNGSFVTQTYSFDDVVATLNDVAKYGWANFLRSRLDAHAAPLDAIAALGWKLVYTDKESDYQKQLGKVTHRPQNFSFSIGLALNKNGNIYDVRWGGPAFKAGVSSGATLVAIDGRAYKPDVLKEAITAATTDKAPIELLIRNQDMYRTIPVDYHGGLQYPHLERVKGTPDYLDQIVAAKK